MELALLLLSSAHKVGNQHFDDPGKFLNLCDFLILSSNKGNSVQITVHISPELFDIELLEELG